MNSLKTFSGCSKHTMSKAVKFEVVGGLYGARDHSNMHISDWFKNVYKQKLKKTTV